MSPPAADLQKIENLLCQAVHRQYKYIYLYIHMIVCVYFYLPAPLQAVDSRDSMAMALYSQCFNWIIRKLNSRIRGKEDFKSISILDIFGFENFEVCFYPPPGETLNI